LSNKILGYLQLIEKSGELSDKNEEYLTIAIQKNKYLKELSDEFFELSKLGNENKEITIEKINLSNLLSDMLMEQYSWICQKGITPQFDIADGIVIKSNTQYLTRIIQNLMSNAEKYAVRHFSVALSESDGKICLAICNDTDDSSIIQPDKFFEPFYKGNARNKKGTGLGLYVVKCLSEKLGYSVTARINENSVFRIEIFI
jgi:signal transduction histidine kinase